MNNDNRVQTDRHAARKLQTRIGNLTHELLASTDYGAALPLAVELMDAIHDLLNRLREPDDTRVQCPTLHDFRRGGNHGR